MGYGRHLSNTGFSGLVADKGAAAAGGGACSVTSTTAPTRAPGSKIGRAHV